MGLGRACRGVDQQPDSVASGDAAGQHCYAGGDHGSDAGFDMGGPVNKVAYAFMLICVAQGVYTVVAIAAVGICIPPLGMGLATLIGRKNFSAEERETGKAALVMGCVGVTEGAIPFAAADPLRVIPPSWSVQFVVQ